MVDYDSVILKSVLQTKPSGIRKFFDLLSNMENVVGLTVGQPDFVTPWHIREAGIESLENGKTYYTSNAGIPELRNEISNYLYRKFHVLYRPETEIIVTVGGSEAIDLAFRTLIGPGDEVILPLPAFVCYEPLIKLAGGVPVIIETTFIEKFKLNPEKLKAAITPRTKMLVLPYPNNPTGAIMTKEELSEIADIIRDTNIIVLSDEIYSEMTYDRVHTSFASLPGMYEHTILVNGFSKTYAMTGWRLGYLCAPEILCLQILKLHQYVIMCAPTTSQYAACEALKNGDDDVAMMIDEYNHRRRYIYNSLKNIGLDSLEPEGAFYIYPNISEYGLTSEEFCEKLLFNYNCAIVPGTAFGDCGEGFVRISYAYSIKHITIALERIEAFLKDLKK